MSKKCEVQLKNKVNSLLVVANSVLRPKFENTGFQRVPVFYLQHLRNILNAEKRGQVELKRPIPQEVLIKFPELYEELGEMEPIDLVKPIEEVKADAPDESKVEEVVETQEEETFVQLTSEEILSMTGKDLKAYVKKHNIDIKGYSSMGVEELRAELLKYFNYTSVETEFETTEGE